MNRWWWLVCFAALLPLNQAEAIKLPAYIWISPAEISQLPRSGQAWQKLKRNADKPLALPNLSDQNDSTDVRVLAKALVFVRTGEQRYRQAVINACISVINSENGGTTLALGRGLLAYVIAAQLVDLPPLAQQQFTHWLKTLLDKPLKGRTLRSTHEQRANNWGTHAGASRAAVAIYLQDEQELRRTAVIFRGWLGERRFYHGFKYKRTERWQGNGQKPIGINAKGASKLGHSIDGVLPEEQRRAGKFSWPPAKEGYVYEALQGALALAVILHRSGYQPFEWSDKALLRAFQWLHQQADFPAQGDDTWLPHIVNYYYGSHFPAPIPSSPGKNVGWTDWTHSHHQQTSPQ